MATTTATRNSRSMTPEELKAARLAQHVPGAIVTDMGTGDGSAVVTWSAGGLFGGVAYKGKAMRSAWGFRFQTEKARTDYIDLWRVSLEHDNAWKARRKQPHTLDVGAILASSHGYEQTTATFYEVTAVRGASVDLRQLQTEQVAGDSWSGKVIPLPGQYAAGVGVITKRPNGENEVSVTAYQLASPWDGRPKHFSSYG